MTKEISMIIIKTFSLFLIIAISSLIGRILSQKYVNRLEELEELKNALNIFKSKIKFTYEPIPEIFKEISQSTYKSVSEVFLNASNKMKELSAGQAWKEALENSNMEVTIEDKNVLIGMSKLLGKTNIEGQISEIKLTSKFQIFHYLYML